MYFIFYKIRDTYSIDDLRRVQQRNSEIICRFSDVKLSLVGRSMEPLGLVFESFRHVGSTETPILRSATIMFHKCHGLIFCRSSEFSRAFESD